jgi:uncharacterized membrane protein YkgB
MANQLKHSFIEYFVGYGLSDERRESAVRLFKLRLLLMVVVIAAAIILGTRVYNSSTWMMVYAGILVLGILLMALSFRWKETAPQLWMAERRALKQQRTDNLRGIEALKEIMQKQGNQNGDGHKH